MEKEAKIFYSPKVDVVFQDYKKALLDCIGSMTDVLKVGVSFESDIESIQEKIALINLLNSQLVAVDKFITGYSKIEETV